MKKDNKMIVLNIILLILNLILIGITCYKTFIYDDKEKNNDNLKNNSGNVDLYSFEETSEIDETILKINYSHIYKSRDYETLINTYYFYEKILPNLSIEPISKFTPRSAKHFNDKTDSEGNFYPIYDEDFEISAKEFGLTVSQIENLDKNIWHNFFGGSLADEFELYDAKPIREMYPMYANLFSKSFFTSPSSLYNVNWKVYAYDAKLDMFITRPVGGMIGGFDVWNIIDKAEDSDTYIVTVAKAKNTFYSLQNDKQENVCKIESGKSEDEAYIRKLIIENSDKLNKYEVKFVKKDGKWTFQDVKSINNN